MPIYEYKCRKCGEVTERIEGSHDRPLSKCPSCGGRTERLMSPGAFILKGTGWYATDYAGKGNGNGGGRAKPSRKEESCPASAGKGSPACAGCPKAE
ncbi:MAG: FmdB family zinc ribbon protein [Gemmatimonadota bacterium]